MPEPYVDGRGVEQAAHPGWTDDQYAQVNALITQEQKVAATVATHEFWETSKADACGSEVDGDAEVAGLGCKVVDALL